MTDKLKPLTPEQQADFDRRRESEAVIQHKCAGCGAWYETDKRNAAFTETFDCDCGERITFNVPARDGVRDLSNAEILDLLDPNQRLDTGMSAKEALRRAQAWWDRLGRHLAIDRAIKDASRAGGPSRAFSDPDPESANHLPSGITNGLTWDLLAKRERIMVAKVWHHFFIRKADLIGGDPDQQFRPQDRKTVN